MRPIGSLGCSAHGVISAEPSADAVDLIAARTRNMASRGLIPALGNDSPMTLQCTAVLHTVSSCPPERQESLMASIHVNATKRGTKTTSRPIKQVGTGIPSPFLRYAAS